MMRLFSPRLKVLVALLLVSAFHAGIWLAAREAVTPADVVGRLTSVSYTPYRNSPQREGEDKAYMEVVRRDVPLLAEAAKRVRTYSTSSMVEQVIPEEAAKNGLRVGLGLWIGADEERNKREIDAAMDLLNRYRGIIRTLYVGNETQVRGEIPLETLIDHIRDIKRRTRGQVDVTTGETWDVWIKYPQLVSAVDVISAHMLPYWEGIPADEAVSYAFKRYDEIRAKYPGKRVDIAEFGWPSQGYNDRAARPGPVLQAQVLRDFITEANRLGISYNIIEAFDQPWKTQEGSVGAYWGIFDADRQPKFPMQGMVEKSYRPVALAALAAGFLLSLVGLRRGRTRFREAFLFAIVANVLGVAVGFALVFPLETYLNLGAAFAWGVGLILMLVLLAVILTKVSELIEVSLGHGPSRLINRLDVGGVGPSEHQGAWIGAKGSPSPSTGEDLHLGPVPKVSIHIPAYKEEPDMLIDTLNSVAALNYPDFEVLVVINNTPEPYFWEPIEAHCKKLGDRFKFVYLPKVAGFKAGALNKAMAFMSPKAEIIALIDADYIVDPNWLNDLVPFFGDPNVAIVQAPQDHRDGGESLFKSFLNDEYAGFFDIGMVQRNEDNAIIAHGTMLLIRRAPFDAAGGWATDTIVEDTEMGLRLLAAGYSAHYTNRRYGWGVLPDTYKAYKTQRHRWAYGAVQIVRKHWRLVLPWTRGLTPAQKTRFVTGWAVWLSDALGAVVAVLSLLWVPVILFVGSRLPITALMAPAIAAVLVHVTHAILLYRLRVRISPKRSFRAAIAAMSLQFTVANAVFKALLTDNLPFQRTQKGGGAKREKKARWENWPETILGVGLVLGSAVLWLNNDTIWFNIMFSQLATWFNTAPLELATHQVREIYIYAIALAVISLPYLAAIFMGILERLSARNLT